MATSKTKKKTKSKIATKITAPAFVDAYFRNAFNGRQAYLEFRPHVTDNTASTESHKLLRTPLVTDIITARLEASKLSADEALELYRNIATGDIGKYLDVDPNGEDFSLSLLDKDGKRKNTRLIKKITKKTERYINRAGEEKATDIVKIDMYDAERAIENLLRVHKILDPKFDKNKGLDVDAFTVPFSIPAHLIAPSFIDVYHDILERGHTEYLFRGGRGSTKSSFVSEIIIELLIAHPDMHALATRQVGNTLRDSVFSQTRWAIHEMGVEDKFKTTVSPLEIEYIPTGQKIYFRGGDDPIKIKSIKPPFGYIGMLWFEELDQFRGQEAVRNIEQSAIRGGDLAYIFKSFNPPRTAANWANKYCKIPKPSQYQHFSNYLGLPEVYFADEDVQAEIPDVIIEGMKQRLGVPRQWLGKTWLEEAEHLEEVNPSAYNHEYGGIATGTGGLVFENTVIRTITDAEIAQFDRILDGVDWGYFPDPFSYGKMYYDAARMDLYIFGEYRGVKKSNKVAYNAIKRNGYDPKRLLIADSAEPKSIADFREYGSNVRGAEKGADSVYYSMKWLQSLHSIIIDDQRAPYHADEFLNYELEKDKNDEFISAYPDKNNHAIDDTRYATNLKWRRRGQ